MLDRTKHEINETDKTRVYREAMSMSVFCHAHLLTSLRNILRKQNVVTSSNLRWIPSGSIVRISGMVIIIHTPPTKSGKRVMFLTLEDEMGLFEVVVFSKAQDRFARIILTSEVLILEGRLKRQGPTGLGLYIRNFGEGSGWPLRAPDETLGLCDENSQN